MPLPPLYPAQAAMATAAAARALRPALAPAPHHQWPPGAAWRRFRCSASSSPTPWRFDDLSNIGGLSSIDDMLRGQMRAMERAQSELLDISRQVSSGTGTCFVGHMMQTVLVFVLGRTCCTRQAVPLWGDLGSTQLTRL